MERVVVLRGIIVVLLADLIGIPMLHLESGLVRHTIVELLLKL
ncbi:hypothetical protein ACQ33O_09405 [Ferruginibacter sp. SUN002]